MEPHVAAELAAVDAVLRGESVEPQHAELAELAVLVAAERPVVDAELERELDERVARFAGGGSRAAKRRPRRRVVWGLSGVASAAVGLLVAVVLVGSSPRQAQRLTTTAAAPAAGGAAASTATTAGGGAPAPAGAGASTGAPTGAPSGARKVVQSAQLALTTAPDRIEQVAGQVFEVVRTEGGFVAQSNVTATGGTDGYAQFQLSVPSSGLADAMGRLSRLRDAHVASRTDTTQDVNDQFGTLTRRLADARALRTALLKQLSGATSPQQVSSLKAQLGDADAAIARAQGALNALNHQINFTQVTLTVSADAGPSGGGGFTIGRAAHDAGRVLTVAAGVALIALAVLVPVGLVAALGLWLAATIRRRRREQALDLA